MEELTKEVIERVAAELQSRCHFKEIETSFRVAEAIIPLAQLPWDDPTKEEAESFHADYYASDSSIPPTLHALVRFIRDRNSALQPKSVDPRWKAILKLTMSWDPESAHEKADEILAALDEVK
jgi:hypothetical protein